jgi:hypothetical protein
MKSHKGKRIAATGLVGVALVATSLIATSAPVAAKAAKTSCSVVTDDKWPSWVQGRPSGINPLTTSHIYMWHDSSGWHIRATHRTTNRKTFSGQLSTRGTFAKVHAVRLEKGDQFQVSKDGHNITFLFKNYGHIDGVDFRTRCAPSVSFAFQSDGRTAPPNRIVIGKKGVHPRSNPFTISRT